MSFHMAAATGYAAFWTVLLISTVGVSFSIPLGRQSAEASDPLGPQSVEVNDALREALIEEIADELMREKHPRGVPDDWQLARDSQDLGNPHQAPDHPRYDEYVRSGNKYSDYNRYLENMFNSPRSFPASWPAKPNHLRHRERSRKRLNSDDVFQFHSSSTPGMRNDGYEIKRDGLAPIANYHTGKAQFQGLPSDDKLLSAMDIQNYDKLVKEFENLDEQGLNDIGITTKNQQTSRAQVTKRHSHKGSRHIRHKPRDHAVGELTRKSNRGFIKNERFDANKARPSSAAANAGEEDPVAMLIREIESIVLPGDSKSKPRKRKAQEVYRYAPERLNEPVTKDLGTSKHFGRKPKHSARGSVLPHSAPTPDELSAVIAELAGIPEEDGYKRKVSAALPFDDADVERLAEVSQALNNDLSSEDKEYLAGLIRQKQLLTRADDHRMRAFDQRPPHRQRNVQASRRSLTAVHGFSDWKGDTASKGMNNAWEGLEEAEKISNKEGEQFSSVDERAPPNLSVRTKGQAAEGVKRAYSNFDAANSTSSLAGQLPSLEEKTRLAGTSNGGFLKPESKDEDIIREIEARVAELEKRLSDKGMERQRNMTLRM